jgi:predicted DNA-binding transcriptional regulator AlpA
MTSDEARELPPTLSAEEAIQLLGCGRTAGYQALKNGTFPVPAWKVGARWYVPTAPLLKLLGIENERPGP